MTEPSTTETAKQPSILTGENLLVKLSELPEKSQEVIRVMEILQKAKEKRERRRHRNLKLKANGGFGALRHIDGKA